MMLLDLLQVNLDLEGVEDFFEGADIAVFYFHFAAVDVLHEGFQLLLGDVAEDDRWVLVGNEREDFLKWKTVNFFLEIDSEDFFFKIFTKFI